MMGWRRSTRRARRQAIAGCGHHYHPTEYGWQCCGCPERVKAGKVAEPQPGTAACRQGPPCDESVELWLAAPAPITRGRRPARRNLKRRLTA